ncbi:galactose-6-phosphate isomerase subunit LacA [Anaerosalibacter massiliensis]|uniref:Galactose-6-phosphate isomerase subunit LacA n=1 Tax=Anaerosalibacter massiliensis TaxID=1347392 RepID=A0A9X2S5D7_9FIRM|nr:galactose-6-phosphate isomerase subunit LacA [Anaerosalibacter massiliensis]MCR2044443.1 galactose-6-phosphate isomerase subunit LacA [Anaerosalibacter massiliensis]
MKVIIGSDVKGFKLKEHLIKFLNSKDYKVVDVSPDPNLNFVESAKLVSEEVLKEEDNFGIVIDEYGAGSFMVANKIKGIICAEVSDEHSAHMTKEHNNTKIISLGSGIIGKTLAENIVMNFLNNEYSGGRHQIRIDMLNRLA